MQYALRNCVHALYHTVTPFVDERLIKLTCVFHHLTRGTLFFAAMCDAIILKVDLHVGIF